jgi:hypothetical protein
VVASGLRGPGLSQGVAGCLRRLWVASRGCGWPQGLRVALWGCEWPWGVAGSPADCGWPCRVADEFRGDLVGTLVALVGHGGPAAGCGYCCCCLLPSSQLVKDQEGGCGRGGGMVGRTGGRWAEEGRDERNLTKPNSWTKLLKELSLQVSQGNQTNAR